MKLNGAIVAFNRGLVSPLAIARVDLKRLALSAETSINWMPRSLGSMMLRPGLQHIGSTASNLPPRSVPFVFSLSDKAILEFTNNLMRVWVDDALVTRAAVTSAVTNGNFDVDLSSWTDNDQAGSTSAWVAGGYMGLTGSGTNAAIRDQTVTVPAASQNVQHALRVIVQRGPVTVRVGTGTSDDSYVSETELQTGAHSLAFTPTGNFNIRFQSRYARQTLVASCNVESSGTMTLPTPYATADLGNIRYDQSADVVFIGCSGYTQRRIERRSNNSWSVVQYLPPDGPFRSANVGPITITPSALSGNITLTASGALFKSTHAPSTNNAGALFRITSQGQQVTATATAQNTFTDAIKVTGVDNARIFTYALSGLSATGSTVTLQRSFDSSTGPWADVTNYVADATTTYDDGLDNQIVWYRIGVKTGNYVAGTIVMTLTYSAGSIDGVARVTSFTSSTVVDAEVLVTLGGTTATDDWNEGEWSDYRGWPTSVAIYESRMGWAGKDGIWLSVSDAYDGFDDNTQGDSGPIARTIGSGPVDTINWMLPLQRLILGGQSAEHSCRSTAFDEPLTPTNFNIKPASTQGSGPVSPVKVDARGMFVQRGSTRLFELEFNPEGFDYASKDLTILVPEIGDPNIIRIAVQRQPDTRVHCIRGDGTAAVLIYDKAENLVCWAELATRSGDLIKDLLVLPGDEGAKEDKVYYFIQRTINAATVTYLEKWALESECQGGTTSKQLDSHIVYSGAATTTITGLSHLEGASVAVWGNGVSLGNYTVSGGQITGLTSAVTSAIVGLAYTGRWKSAKLSEALGAHARVDHMAPILHNTHYQGLEFGPDFDHLDPMPLTDEGTAVGANTIYSTYDREPIPFPSTWSTDARICLQATAPKPCTILAVKVNGEVYA